MAAEKCNSMIHLPTVFINHGSVATRCHTLTTWRLSIMRKEQSISEKRERDFTGVFIPSRLYLTNKFSPREKFLLVEIYSLRKKDKSGDCFASNRHFADFIGVSERTVQSMLNGLKTEGYVEAWYEYEKENPKVIHCRHLVLTEKFYEEFINEHEVKQPAEHGEKKHMGDGEKKCTSRGEEICMYKYNKGLSITEEKNTDKDCTLSSTEEKTLPSSGKGVKTSATNNINILNINNIPSRTTEQKEVYRKQKQKNRSEKYRDEDVPQILYNEFNSLYGEQGNILEDHDICLTMAVIAYYFKQYREHMGEQHIMISAEYADQFMGVIIGDDSPLLKADVEEKDELRFYQDMIDEFFKSDLGQRNGKDFDHHIWLFFSERNQDILCERVKQKWEEQEYTD